MQTLLGAGQHQKQCKIVSGKKHQESNDQKKSLIAFFQQKMILAKKNEPSVERNPDTQPMGVSLPVVVEFGIGRRV